MPWMKSIIVKRSTMLVAGRKTRYYALEYAPRTTEELAFVLYGKDEYQVLCRRHFRQGRLRADQPGAGQLRLEV